jgi:hypothetical protein
MSQRPTPVAVVAPNLRPTGGAVDPWFDKARQDIGAKAAEFGLQPISQVEELSFFNFVQRFQNGFDVY